MTSFSGSSVSQTPGCERTSRSQRSRWRGLRILAINHLSSIPLRCDMIECFDIALVSSGSLLLSNPTSAQFVPSAKKARARPDHQRTKLGMLEKFDYISGPDQPWGSPEPLWGCALRHGSQEPESDCKIAYQVKPRTIDTHFPRCAWTT